MINYFLCFRKKNKGTLPLRKNQYFNEILIKIVFYLKIQI